METGNNRGAVMKVNGNLKLRDIAYTNLLLDKYLRNENRSSEK